MSEASQTEYVLPESLVGSVDVARLLREVETVDGDVQAQKVRDPSKAPRLPGLSQGLSDFLDQNDIDIADGQVLLGLKERLRKLKDHAPVIHLTFAGEADPQSLQKLVLWLRREIHPHTLVAVGIQPSLVGGVYVRTPNHIHDFSIRSLLKEQSSQFIAAKLEEISAR